MGGRSSRQTTPTIERTSNQIEEAPSAIPVSDKNKKEQDPQKLLLLTPRREDALYCKVAYTPAGDMADVYKYYCPLCMSFFKDILKSGCCGNYICSECCVDFLSNQQYKVDTISTLLAGAPYEDVCCPNCNTTGFTPVLVSHSDIVRDYSDNGGPSPAVASCLSAAPSPMKIGDSFEDMKRKMVPLHHQKDQKSTAVVIKSNARLRTFSPDASLDRLISSPLEFDSVAEGGGDGGEETRGAQLSARGEEEPVTTGRTLACTEENPVPSRALRGIALASPASSRRSSGEMSSGTADLGEVKSFAAQFVSSIFVSNSVPRGPAAVKVSPIGLGGSVGIASGSPGDIRRGLPPQ